MRRARPTAVTRWPVTTESLWRVERRRWSPNRVEGGRSGAGVTVTLLGSGFLAGETVSVYVDADSDAILGNSFEFRVSALSAAEYVGLAETDSNGSFEINYRIVGGADLRSLISRHGDDVLPLTYTFQAAGDQTNRLATAEYTLDALSS